jgi:predicted helicase
MFDRELGIASSDVTLLDPCIGTGTFLAKAFVTVLEEIKNQYQGSEISVIREHLLKNFMGLEISIAPYVISHLKLNLLLNNNDYHLDKNERIQVYLTNTLDPGEISELGAFMGVLSSEIKNANEIKINLPIMIVLGNPPYFKRSANKSYWILELLEDYKKDLNEKRLGNLDDDYVKFIRFAQWKIEKNGHGIIGFITNNSFIDNTTFRRMRQSLSETFNYIYILNLHGDSNLKEMTPYGEKDENVFDIQQGVSISFFVKIKDSTEHHLFYYDLWGTRSSKFSFLNSNDINSINWKKIPTNQKYYLFEPLPVKLGEKYEKYIAINKIFSNIISGLETKKDNFIVNFTREDLVKKLNKFVNPHYTDEDIKLDLVLDDIIIKDSNGKNQYEFRVSEARNAISKEGIQDRLIRHYNYRPFDKRWIYFSSKCISRTRQPLSNIVADRDVCLCISRMT